jgi:hypothetical protein
VEYGKDLDLIVNDPVDKPVWAEKHFADGLVLEFWYNASRERKVSQAIDGRDELRGH